MAEIKIYTKNYCPFCDRAKALFKGKNVSFSEIKVDDQPELYTELKQKTGMMTVPQIFIGEKLIGGYTELAALDQQGGLDPLIK